VKLITDLEFAPARSVGPEPRERAAGMSRDNPWGQGHKERALHRRRRQRNSITSLNSRANSASCSGCGMPFLFV
jgi:hypothetical protein